MSARVAKLEALLERVQKNAARPRPARFLGAAADVGSGAEAPEPARGGAGPTTAEAKQDLLELDEPTLSEPPPASTEEVQDVGEDDLEMEEAPPESGPAPVGEPQTIEDAMSAADAQPPMTPPPESGEEPAPQVSIPRDSGPTMEQLGNTIDLEQSGSRDSSIEEGAKPAGKAEDQLQAEIPQAPAQGENVELPENAREELERVRLGQTTEVRPVLSTRPVISTNVVEFVSAARRVEPETFLELVESSLKL